MTKIGILTFQRTVNYGAQFQNFALSEYIKGRNVEAEVIDYHNEAIDSVEKPAPFYKKKGIKAALKAIRYGKKQREKWNKFEAFRSSHLNYSAPCNKNTIESICEAYDGIVVGSDQIWNTDITNSDYVYFLDFLKEDDKKYSYAASFGYSELPANEKKTILSLIKKFKSITLREKSAMKMLDTISKEKTCVVDPTFLLDKEEWTSKLNLKKNKRQKKYIFVYMVDENKENLEKIYELAEREQLDIIHIRDGFKNLKNIQSVRDASPEEFLNLLYGAEYVVVGSFHGLCLSLIFEKQFYYFLNKTHNRNSRLIDLLDSVGLTDRSNFMNDERIDYAEVRKTLNDNIVKSKKILDDIILSICKGANKS